MRVTERLQVGEYKIIQDTELYRFTSDAVLLARAVRAKRGETVADFCSGSGIVGLHFFAENEGIKKVVLFEADKSLADMSRETVSINHLEDVFTVETLRVQDIPSSFNEAFSLILCNPPYVQGGFAREGVVAPCCKELTLSLPELCMAAKKCLRFHGRIALIHRADRLAELCYTLHGYALEPKTVQFVSGKAGAKPYAVIVVAVKGGKAGTDLLPPIVNEVLS